MNFVMRSSLLIVTIYLASCTGFWDRPATPLHDAAFRGDVRMIRELVAAGVNVNEQDPLGNTALFWAARGGHPQGPHQCGGEADGRPETIAALLELGANPNVQDSRPKGFGRSSGWTPLFVALHHEQFKSAQILLRYGADPNIRSDQGLSVLEMASDEGAPPQLLALMLEKGFDPRKAKRRE
jgi:ankyrin repeat protein